VSRARKTFQGETGLGPEGVQLLAITHTHLQDMMNERKIAFMVLADYDVAPYGFNDFFDAVQVFCSLEILGLGIGNVDRRYPLFGIPQMRLFPKTRVNRAALFPPLTMQRIESATILEYTPCQRTSIISTHTIQRCPECSSLSLGRIKPCTWRALPMKQSLFFLHLLDLIDHFRNCLEEIGHESVVSKLEYGSVLIPVDGHDHLG